MTAESKRLSPSVDAPKSRIMVRVENITKDFGKLRAIDQMSFEMRQGEVLGFLGPNGAGKTTVVRILTGFFPPSSGRVFIGDQELTHHPKEIKKRIGYLPETVHLYTDMRVNEYLEFVSRVRGVSAKKRKAHLEEKLARCGLWDVRQRLVGHLSKGFRQRVGLAQALIGDPEVLVLDEPTTGLDPKQNVEIRSLIRELGRERTLILSTHILPEVSMVCDRVLIINQGRIVAAGTADELEAGLKKRQNIFVVIGDPAKKSSALEILGSLPGVERITVMEEKADQVSFTLSVAKERDLRPEITRLFVKRGISLLEIRSGRLSLEEIFMKIVVNEEPARGF